MPLQGDHGGQDEGQPGYAVCQRLDPDVVPGKDDRSDDAGHDVHRNTTTNRAAPSTVDSQSI
jgi:hypothetical protein